MKTWKTAEVVELSIKETAHGRKDWIIEISHNGRGTNNDMIDGNDTPGSEPNPSQSDNEGKGESVTPDIFS